MFYLYLYVKLDIFYGKILVGKGENHEENFTINDGYAAHAIRL